MTPLAAKVLELAAAEVGVREHGAPPQFWAKVAAAGNVCECWEWTACKDQHGYGKVKTPGGVKYAHRVAFQSTRGEIGLGLELDHLCRNRGCVNPWHLEPVTGVENIRRGTLGKVVADRAARTHCRHGHEFTPENTKMRTSDDRPSAFRECRTCIKDAYDRRRARARCQN